MTVSDALDKSMKSGVDMIFEFFGDQEDEHTSEALRDELACLMGALVPGWDDRQSTMSDAKKAANYDEAVRRLNVLAEHAGWFM